MLTRLPPRLLPRRLRWTRLLLPVAALGLFLVVVLAAGLIVVGQFTAGGGGTSGPCDAGDTAPTTAVPVTAADLDPAQKQTAATIIGVGKGMAAPPRAWVVALATAMQESRMGTAGMNLAVDHDSLKAANAMRRARV